MYNEILLHIAKSFLKANLLHSRFATSKKISFEFEEGKIVDKTVFAMESKISNSSFKVLGVETAYDPAPPEYWFLLQFDDLTPYALEILSNNEKSHCWYFHNDRGWLNLSTFQLAKLLVGVEQVNELFMNFKPIFNIDIPYNHLISAMDNAEHQDN